MRCLVALPLLLLLAGTAAPASADDRQTCMSDGQVVPDRRIAACTSLIRDKKTDEDTLYRAYFGRAYGLAEKGDQDGAMADFDDVIRRWPQEGLAYGNRGVMWARKGDFARAIDDFTQAIALNPKDAKSYRDRSHNRNRIGDDAGAVSDATEAIRLEPEDSVAYDDRGHGEFNLRQYDLAAVDFRRALRLSPGDAYAAVWMFLSDARVSGAAEAQRDLDENLKGLKEAWPAPVARFLAGRIDAEALRRAAAQGDAKVRGGQACEADFYIGQWHQLNRRDDEARVLFERAAASCPKNFFEYATAVATLKAPPSAPDPAALAADQAACAGTDAPAADRIAACTRILSAGPHDKATLAGLYRRRAAAFAAQGDRDRALADLDEVIRRSPDDAQAYS
jgi:lipoprotein NlpI